MTGVEFLKALSEKYYPTSETGQHHTKKPDYYFEIYNSYFERLRDRPLEILELGVYTGASLLVWREYFPNAKIVGLDLSPAPPGLDAYKADGRISTVQGDQSNSADLQRCLDLTSGGKFDIVIDDASHRGWPSKASFDYLFRDGLKDEGLYFIEDFATSYATALGGVDFKQHPPVKEGDAVYPSHDGGIVGWLKQVIDDLTLRYYADPEKTLRPIASCHFWPNVALIQRLGSAPHLV